MAARQNRIELPTDDAGQRACARGPWCSASTRDTEGMWHPARTYAAFCAADQAKVTADAESLPAAWDRLSAAIGAPARRGTPVRVPPGSRVLVSADTDALLRDIADTAAGWAARTRAVPGLQLARHDCAHGTRGQVAADCAILALHTVPLLALPPAPMSRTWHWHSGSPMPPDLAMDLADTEILHIGDDWVRAQVMLSGEDAGLEIIALHRRAVRLLGETPAPPVILDGIPCRNCEAMSSLAVLEQPQPDPGQPDPPYVRCLECRDELSRAEYRDWTRQYAAWIGGSGILVCRRCEMGACATDPKACSWAGCTCRHAGRAA